MVLEEEEDFFCDADEGELSGQGQVHVPKVTFFKAPDFQNPKYMNY